MSKSKWSLLVLLLPLLSGCGVFSKVDQMSQDTSNMKGNTDKMVGNTADLDKKGATLTTETCTLLRDLRQGDTRNIRADTMFKEMDSAPTMESKVAVAGHYFMSFEFQLIDDGNCDNAETREVLYSAAFEEFFYAVTKYMPHADASLDPASSDPQEQGMFALAAASEKVNPNRAQIDTDQHLASVSFLSLIEATLPKVSQVDSGEIQKSDLLPHEIFILNNYQAAVQLLKARANFFPASTLAKITTVQKDADEELLGFIPIGWLVTAKDLFLGTQVTFDNLVNVVEIDKTKGDMVDDANQQIDYLQQQKIPFEINGTLQEFYSHLKFPAPGSSKFDKQLSAAERRVRIASETALLTSLHGLRKRIGAE